MKLVTSLQMRECDRRTIAGENLPAPTPGLTLMERAGWGIFAALRQHCAHLRGRPILIFCGRGNNGGDGLVVARLLFESGHLPHVLLLAEPDELSPDAAVQYRRFTELGGPARIVRDDEELVAIVKQELRGAQRHAPLLVDALLGTGSRGAPRGLAASAVALIERLREERGGEVLAIDLPTGVNADTGEVVGGAVRAHVTVTLAYLKVGFLFHPARSHLGRVRLVDIGIPHSVEEDVGLPLELLTREAVRELLPSRPPDAHKGRVGKILIVGGSPGLSGAPAMAARAATRCGAGLVTVALPEGLNTALEAKLDEVMTYPCPQTATGGLSREGQDAILERAKDTDVWILGPGLGREEASLDLVRNLVARLPGPMVLDADALFALATGERRRPVEAPPPVLTPHPGEMARLLRANSAGLGAPPWELAPRFAQERGCVLVLKGAPTVVAAPDGRTWVNPTGNAGLASGGSGDVLSGVIGALLGQGVNPVDAARAGVFLHGYAADLGAARKGVAGLVPPDVIEALPDAWKLLASGLVAGLEREDWISSAGFPVP